MLHHIALITVVSLAPLTSFADVAPRGPKDLGLPGDCILRPATNTPDVPWHVEAPESIVEPGCTVHEPEPGTSEESTAPGLVLPPEWRPQVGHLPVIGR